MAPPVSTRAPTVADLIAAMEQIAPTRHAESWDNVGLIAGDERAEADRVMLCIDLTPEVAAEAADREARAVVAYHPPLFKAVKRLAAGDPVWEMIRRGIAIYSPHTALDVAEGGTNDVLADALRLTDRQPLRPAPAGEGFKLVTFVPEEAVERVSDAIFRAGAGRIGQYRECSFRSPGTGTFFGEEGSNPAVGQSGRREQAAELRLETVVSAADLSAVVAALREAHPYEEPAFDLVKLQAQPEGVGLGRIGTFAEPVARHVLVSRLKRELRLDHVLLAGPEDGEVRTVACCAGSCGDLLEDAARRGVEVYVTGELKHHDALRCVRLGMAAVCLLHSNSERATLSRLKARLTELLPGADVLLSGADRDPFRVL